MNPYHSLVSERAGGRCEYCLAPDSAFNFPLEVDHFVPGSAGGSNDPENLVLACRSCNSYKAFHQLGLSERNPDEPLFNPRIEIWLIHFRLDLETAEIIGLTPIGIGTVNRLRLNSPAQIRARRFWLSTGLIGGE
jgi:hypothetical protein